MPLALYKPRYPGNAAAVSGQPERTASQKKRPRESTGRKVTSKSRKKPESPVKPSWKWTLISRGLALAGCGLSCCRRNT